MENPDIFPVGRPWRLPLCAGLILAAISVDAAELDVTVLDKNGRPVPGVAVYIEADPEISSPTIVNAAVMKLANSQFVPELLVVQTGTRVRFPNGDVVAHHVYSFSSPNNFVLPMFKGNATPQVEFDDAGVVTIGCNLHDDMVAYILVVNSPTFGTTGTDGTTRLIADNPDGLAVSIWSPRIKLDDENLTQIVKAGRSAQLTFVLNEELRASRNDQSVALSWSEN
jgi:plastocyanin